MHESTDDSGPAEVFFEREKPLAPLTTIGIGGLAEWFADVDTADELKAALRWADKNGIPVFILGGGSNMLVADSGWPGLVVRVRIKTIRFFEHDEELIVAGAGVEWDAFVKAMVERNYQGIECLSGIPGNVGASPIQNIGAYGQEVKDVIEWVNTIDRQTGEEKAFRGDECNFAYRMSRFKGQDRDKYVVTSVAFRLKKNGRPDLRYGDLTRYFEREGVSEPSLADVRRAVLEVRRGKGMVIDPDIPDSRSCGSFFMNPIVTADEAEQVRKLAERDGMIDEGQKMPEYPAGPRQIKLSAAWLMEKAGLQKGYCSGNVGLSTRHVLALVNRGGGSAAEILTLVDHVKRTVREKFEVELHPEPIFVGFEKSINNSRTDIPVCQNSKIDIPVYPRPASDKTKQ